MTHTPLPIGVLNYNVGNARNVERALERLGIPYASIENSAQLQTVSGLIFPGVGAAGSVMDNLRQCGFIEPLRRFEKPFLGVCLGMQLLFETSEEGNTQCLGMIPGNVRALPDTIVEPHMGWNKLSTGEYAYFVHSYVCVPLNPGVITMTTKYGADICAGVQEHNFFGLQWHPEKSGAIGDRYLLAFAALCSERSPVPRSRSIITSPTKP